METNCEQRDADDGTALRQKIEAGEIRRVLALRASRLGDLLMTTPTLRALREAHPALHVTLLTNPYSAELVRGNPDVDDVLLFAGRERDLVSRRGRRFAASLRDRFDLLLALRPRKGLEAFAAAAGIDHVFPRGDQGSDRSTHVVQQCFDRIATLGLAGSPGPLRLVLEDEERAAARTRFEVPERYVHLHPGCDETFRWRLRRGVRRRVWPTQHWIEFIDSLESELGLRAVLTSGSDIEGHWTREIADSCVRARPLRVHRPTLRELASVTQGALACVTVDTGPLHIATALAPLLIGLYGPSPTSFTGPWDPRGRSVALARELPCMPCQGKSLRCPRNVCMEEITPREVLRTLRSRIAKCVDSDGDSGGLRLVGGHDARG